MSGVARPGSRSNACAGTSYARANLAGAGDVWGLVPPAVFKTVCGALMRRPGWVRFPSIPANHPLRTQQVVGWRITRPVWQPIEQLDHGQLTEQSANPRPPGVYAWTEYMVAI